MMNVTNVSLWPIRPTWLIRLARLTRPTWPLSLLGAALFLGIALGTLALPAAPAYALERQSGDTATVPVGATVDDDLFISGRSVRIDGRVRGDVYAFAKTITVTGVIDGDLFAAGAQVVVDGQVQGNVRAAGATLQVNGTVGQNVLGAGQLLQLGSGGHVAGNLIGAGETVSLAGDVNGTVTGTGQSFDLQGTIGKKAELTLDSLTLGPRAHIGGTLTYYADHEVTIPPERVTGGVTFVPVQREHSAPEHVPAGQRFNALGNFFSLIWLAGCALIGLVLLRLFPRFAAEFLGVLETRPLPSLGLGVLALIGTIPIAIVMAVTIIGLPVALLLGAGYFTGLLVGWLFLALATGSILIGLLRKGHPWHPSWAFLLGLLVLYVATRLPIVGALVTFIGLSFGLGTFLFSLYRSWRRGAEPLTPGGPGEARPSVMPAPAVV
jgi:cytoskeletal protein CcmA (bactofilin family)